MTYTHTDVWALTTPEAVDEFCTKLQRLKACAPVSLKIVVAVTFSREVEMRRRCDAATEDETAAALGLRSVARAAPAPVPLSSGLVRHSAFRRRRGG